MLKGLAEGLAIILGNSKVSVHCNGPYVFEFYRDSFLLENPHGIPQHSLANRFQLCGGVGGLREGLFNMKMVLKSLFATCGVFVLYLAESS
jgi:hypothetical protein